jgi:hypothetical protein
LGKLEQLSAVDERFQDVLLDVVIPVDDCGEFFAELRQILDCLGPIHDPVVELCRNLAQDIPADRIEISIRAKETNHALLLLERLNDSVQQNAIETTVAESDAILVMLVESLHRTSFQLSQTAG